MSSEYKEMTVIVVGDSKAEEKVRIQKALMEAAGKETKLHFKDAAVVHGLSATMFAAAAAVNSQCKKEPYYRRARNKKQKRQKPR